MIDTKKQYEIIFSAIFRDLGRFKKMALSDESLISQVSKSKATNSSAWAASVVLDDFLPCLEKSPMKKYFDWNKIAIDSSCFDSENNKLILEASRIAMGGFDSEEEAFDSLSTSPVFSKIFPEDNGIESDYYYPIRNLKTGNSFPFPKKEKEKKESLILQWKGFVESLKSVDNLQSPLMLLAKIKDLVFEWCWCIPYTNIGSNDDISIYDHVSATTVILLSLVLSDNKEKPFRFVVGDLSGIQKFIFQSKNQVFHGAARTFRSRSFIISVMSTAFKLGLSDRLGIIPFFDLIDAGGRFTFILPNMEGLDEILSKYQEDVEVFLFKKYLGTLCVVMDYSLIGGKDTFLISEETSKSPFQSLLTETSRLLSLQKTRKFSKALSTNGFVFRNEPIEGKRCSACGIRIGGEDGLCEECRKQMTFGGKLPNESSIYFTLSECSDGIEILPSVRISFGCGGENDLTYALPFKNKVKEHYPVWRINMHAPNMEFADIAKKSLIKIKDENRSAVYGNPLLAYIKIDVDNLGEIFIGGMKKESYSLTRYTTLSRMLSQFFSMHVASILDEEKFVDTYTIINGGDDIFIVLPWTKAIPFLLRLKKDFSLFCSCNKRMHFSAGVAIEGKNTPFSKCNRNAEDAEHQAKHYEGKNCVSIWNHVYSFDSLSLLYEKIERLRSFCDFQNPIISKSFVYRNYLYMEEWICDDKHPERKYEVIPKFRYDLARTYERMKSDERREEAIKFFMDGFNSVVVSPGELEAKMYRDALVTVIYERREYSDVKEG